MSAQTSFAPRAPRETPTLAGLGVINVPSKPSGKHSVAQQLASHRFTTFLSPIFESPSVARTLVRGGYFSSSDPSIFLLVSTPEDRSDPTSQFIDGLRERDYFDNHTLGSPKSGVPQNDQLSSATELAGQGSEESSQTPYCDCEHCGEGYFATWEDDDDDDFDQQSSTSSILPDTLDDFDDGAKTPCASSYTKVPRNTPASSGAQTRALGSFSDVVVNAFDTPRAEVASSAWPSHLPTEPGNGIQSLFEQLFDESAFADVDAEDDDFITSYSTSSDSCPPTPPLSDIGDNVSADGSPEQSTWI